jgi:hypothetical protein
LDGGIPLTMKRYRVASSTRINARPAQVYAAIADYRPARPCVSGSLERLFTSVMLPRIYKKELAQL